MNISGKRVNFINIQNSHTVAANGYEVLPFRTGYEQVIAGRTDKLFSSVAKEDGKVVDVNEKALTIEYKSGAKEYIELGVKHGTVSGSVVPHTLTTDLKVGDKVKAGDVVAFNDGFFERDVLNPGMAVYKAGTLATVALLESADTLEDGNAITEKLANRLIAKNSEVKTILVDFTTSIHGLIGIGKEVEPDTILCTLEDAVSADLTESNPDTIEALRQITSANPKAKVSGKITDIEVLYFGEIEDMTPSLQAIAKEGDKRRAERSKLLGDGVPKTGKIDESIHLGGNKLLENMLGIKIYIDNSLAMGTGDKVVFGNALKSTCSRVITDPVVTESGQEVDAIFGYQSVANRIVISPEIQGTMNVILKKLSSEMVNIYKGK